MFTRAALLFLLLSPTLLVGQTAERSQLDPARWGVVYDTPATKGVKVRTNIPYLTGLSVDVYSPPNVKAGKNGRR